MMLPQLTNAAETLFPDLDLGDVRRDRRFRRVVQAFADQPGASLPQLFPNPTDYHNCLHLLNSPHCTHQAILDAHQVAAIEAMEAHRGVVLILHDATVLDFSGHTTLGDELGEVGNGGGLGWIAHQSLAVNPENRAVFGLVSQILHVREKVAKGETVAARRQRKGRESRLWQRGLEGIGPTPEGATWIDVADRGADAFEFLQHLRDRGRRFVVRSHHNRALGSGPTDEKSLERLHEKLRQQDAITTWARKIPQRAGQAEREVHLSASACEAELRPPHVKKGAYRDEVVTVHAVRIWEPNPPAGQEGLEWLLLTSEAISTAAEVRAVGDWYTCRMQIEEYHKVQKSGVGVEGYQLQSATRMATLVAMLSVVAVGLMNLRLAVRAPETAARPAEEIVPKVWVAVLSVYQTGQVLAWTVGQFWIALARLGGYQKNPAKHPPGWITLWRGWNLLHPLIRYHHQSTPKMS